MLHKHIRECMGIEPTTKTPENPAFPHQGGVESGALAPEKPAIDPALASIIAAWPTLPKHIRDTIQMLVESCIGGADR